ncbi:MAG: hypothetical protein RI973_2367 [Bacteroidota bacterium]|jgi:O-antigen ligase
MPILLQSYKAQTVILLFIWLVSMLLSAEFVLSVAMIALVLLSLFELKIDGPQVRLLPRSNLQDNLRRFFSYKAWPAVAIPFLLVLASALWSEDGTYTLQRLRIKLPFLVLPFAFASMPALGRRELLTIFYFLLVLMSAISLYVLVDFLMHYDAVMASLGKGGHLPTPSNHIRFSITLALAILAGGLLWQEHFYFIKPQERWLTGGLTLFLFLFIHLLSVRSGIVSLYLALLVLGLHQVFFKKRIRLGLAMAALVLVLPLAAYQTLPSFRLKVDYARWDYLQFAQGKGAGYPDSERITSMLTGLEIGQSSPWFGIGAGDLRSEVKKRYETQYAGQYEFKMPHNQFITIFAGTGLIGLLLFLFGFFFPLFYRNNIRNPLFLAFHAIFFMSFFVENTIENNFGVSLYLFFLLAGLNHLSTEPSGAS